MIAWKRYDKLNPPPLNKEYIVFYSGSVRIAWLERHYPKEIPVWVFEFDETSDGISHYAEINLPIEEMEESQ